jgi:hypothetical protein
VWGPDRRRSGPHFWSIAKFRDVRSWYSSPKTLDLEEHRVMEGLRRTGFPET